VYVLFPQAEHSRQVYNPTLLSQCTFNLQTESLELQKQSIFTENKNKIYQVSLIVEIAKQRALQLLKILE